MSLDFERVKTVFQTAVDEHPPEEWDSYLEAACAGDLDLRREVNALLRAHKDGGSLLDSPVFAANGAEMVASLTEHPGTVIGPYKLLQQIGEGGMGVVFMAEQTHPVKRTVALKIIKPGMDTRQVIARFEAERQALAMMDHPNIARVIDAGTTETGRPYFVMDLVKGAPITEYCDQQHLAVRQRLELLMQVCHAVQHAHQKGIIHRDLKPSNVLVAEYDGKPVPKIIDFGVAKATVQPLTERTMFTEYGQLIGSFEYMSPEQARFNQLDVDTRSDIYSLGVLLYELLTGSTPLKKERLRTAAFDEILRLISEEDPPRPSTRLSFSQALPSIAANRSLEPKKLTGLVSGELDWIAMKCLEKERNRRYEAVSTLATDLQHYLADEPVVARPATWLYRLKKFIHRNKVGVAAATAVALALALGLVLAVYGLLQARRQAQIARIHAVRSEQVAVFLKDMLAGAGPSVARGRDATLLHEILDQTAERVGKDLKDQPEVEAELKTTIGKVYQQVGAYAKAEVMHRQALEIQKKAIGHAPTAEADILDNLARSLWKQRKLDAAESLQREALAMRKNLLGDDHPDVALSMSNLARVLNLQGKWIEGRAMLRDAIAIQKKAFGNDSPKVAVTLKNLADLLWQARRYAEAEQFIREALAIQIKRSNRETPDMADSLNVLANVLRHRGSFTEAEATYRQALALRRKLLGNDHPDVATCLINLTACLRAQKKYADARAAAEEAVAVYEHHPGYGSPFAILGQILLDLGDGPAAEALANKLVRQAESAATSHQRADAYVAAIPLLVANNRHEQARELSRKLIALRPPNTYSLNSVAWALATNANPAHADPIVAVELAKRAVELAPNDGNLWNTLGIARYRAGEWREAINDLQKSIDFGDRGVPIAWLFLAMSYWQLGDHTESRKWYDKAIEWIDNNPTSDEELNGFHAEAAKLLGDIKQQPSINKLQTDDEQRTTDKK